MDKLTRWFVIGFFVFLWLQIPPQIRSDIISATLGALFAGVGTTVSTTASTVTPYTARTVAEDTSVGSILLAFTAAGILYFSLRGKVSAGGGGGGQRPSGGGGNPQRSGGGSGGGGQRPPADSADYKAYLPYVMLVVVVVVAAFTPFGRDLIASANFGDIVGRVRSLIP